MIPIGRRVLARSSRAFHLGRNQVAGYSKSRLWLAIGIAFIALSITSLTGLNEVARSWVRPQLMNQSAIATAQQPSAQAFGPCLKLQAELITLLPQGFMPATITRPKGPFAIAGDNRSRLEVISLRLTRETGDKIHEVTVSRGKLDWNEVLNLSPGRYALSEINHPEWRCALIITDK